MKARLRRRIFALLALARAAPKARAFPSTSANANAAMIVRSYTLKGDGLPSEGAVINEIHPAPHDPNAEEDEVEQLYPTSRRAFAFPNHVGTVLNIRQTSFGLGRLGATVWPSSMALATLLANDARDLARGRSVIELGSGCGLPSLVAKEVCDVERVLATDYWEDGKEDYGGGDRLVPRDMFGANLAYNVGISEDGAPSSVRRLDWHDEMGIFEVANGFRPDLIIGSDLVYYPMDCQPLLQTLEILLKADGGGGESGKDALLVLPLPPAEREALPDFRARLESEKLGIDGCEVVMDELEMVERRVVDNVYVDDDREGRHNLLRVRIRHRPS